MALREITSVQVPAGQGAACTVQAGQYVRVVDLDGGQVADFNAWTLPDYQEQFWSGRTRIVEGAHLSTGNRLWSSPHMEVLFTITADTVKRVDSPLGGISHDLVYARCSSQLWQLRGVNNAPNCQDNLVRAIESHGLTAHNVHDAFNIFMKTGIGKDDRLFEEPPNPWPETTWNCAPRRTAWWPCRRARDAATAFRNGRVDRCGWTCWRRSEDVAGRFQDTGQSARVTPRPGGWRREGRRWVLSSATETRAITPGPSRDRDGRMPKPCVRSLVNECSIEPRRHASRTPPSQPLRRSFSRPMP